MGKQTGSVRKRLPPIAMAAGALGLALTASLAVFIGMQALRESDVPVPVITVEAGAVHRTTAGFVAEFEVRNRSAHTAANVEVEASFKVTGFEPLVNTVSVGYVPGHSFQRGGVLLPADPRSGKFELRVLGFTEP
jgi:uncharacterized protein (TIGR02588 family)